MIPDTWVESRKYPCIIALFLCLSLLMYYSALLETEYWVWWTWSTQYRCSWVSTNYSSVKQKKNIINVNEYKKAWNFQVDCVNILNDLGFWMLWTKFKSFKFTAKLFPIPENWQNLWLYNILITKRCSPEYLNDSHHKLVFTKNYLQ